MMRTVHAQTRLPVILASSEFAVNATSCTNRARLVQPLMVQRAGNLLADVRDQLSAKRDVQQLMSATDRQQRFALAENFVNQNQFEQIAFAAVGRCSMVARIARGRFFLCKGRD
jgi:hypothetical protein